VWYTVDCFFIENVEILDNRHFQLNFSNPFTVEERLNPALYSLDSYQVTPAPGGLVDGVGISINSIFIEKSITAKYVILELKNPVTPGAMYQFTASRLIIDMYRQNLRSFGRGLGLVRRTKVDKVISNLPEMYRSLFTSAFDETQNFVSPYMIIAASAVEDEKIGGNF
jgi:ribosomal protein S17E